MTIINSYGTVTTVVEVPQDYEIYQPFQFGPDGGVLSVSDPVRRAIQHILAIAFTAPGERVMRPTYGVGLQALLFSNLAPGQFSSIAEALQTGFANTDGSIAVVDVAPVVSTSTPGTYMLNIEFTLNQSPTKYSAVFDYSGNLVSADGAGNV